MATHQEQHLEIFGQIGTFLGEEIKTKFESAVGASQADIDQLNQVMVIVKRVLDAEQDEDGFQEAGNVISSMADMLSRIEELEAYNVTLMGDETVPGSILQIVTSMMEGLDAESVNNINIAIGSINNQITVINNKIVTIENKFGDMNFEETVNFAGLSTLTDIVKAIDARFDALEQRVLKIESDIVLDASAIIAKFKTNFSVAFN